MVAISCCKAVCYWSAICLRRPPECRCGLRSPCSQVAAQGQPGEGDRHLLTRSWKNRESGQKRFKTVVRPADVMYLDALGAAG